jgi:hypothetical protein
MYHSKHVEQFPDINKLCKVASCWKYIGIILAHPILHISRIRVNRHFVNFKTRLNLQNISHCRLSKRSVDILVFNPCGLQCNCDEGKVVPDTPLNCAKLFETICRADARCQHQSAGRQGRRHYVRRRAGVQRGNIMYMSLSVTAHGHLWHVPAASLHDMTGNVHIDVTSRHVCVTILTVEGQKYYIFCVCVCVCVCGVCVCVCAHVCVFVALVIEHAKRMHPIILYCLWPDWFCRIFPHYLLNGTIFGERFSNIKCVFWFSL